MALARLIKAGSAFIEVLLDKSPFLRDLRSLGNDVRDIGKKITAVGAGISAASTAALAGFTALTVEFTGIAGQLDDVSQRTGVAASSLSALKFAAEQVGSSFEVVEKALLKQSAFLKQVASGGKEAVGTLQDLGITAESFLGATQEERFLLLADGISKIEDEGLRAATAMKVFGKSGAELIPLLNGGSAAINQLTAQAAELNLVLSDTDVAAGAMLGDTIDQLFASFTALRNIVGAALVPEFQMLTETAVRLVSTTVDLVNGNREWFVAAFNVALAAGAAGAAITGLGITVTAVGATLASATAIAGALTSAIAAISSPVGISIASIVGLLAVLVDWASLGNRVSEVFNKELPRSLKAFRDAIQAGEIKLAFDILLETVKIKTIAIGKEIAIGIAKAVLDAIRDIGRKQYLAPDKKLPGTVYDYVDKAKLLEAAGVKSSSRSVETMQDRLDRLISQADAAKRAMDGAADVANIPNGKEQPGTNRWAQMQAEEAIRIRQRAAFEQQQLAVQNQQHEEQLLRAQQAAVQRHLAAIQQAQQQAAQAGAADQMAAMQRLREVVNRPIEFELPQRDEFLAELDQVAQEVGQAPIDSFAERLGTSMQAAVEEIKSVSTFSATEAGRTAGFLAGQKKNPNEKLEGLTGQQNGLLREQLGIWKNLEVAQ